MHEGVSGGLRRVLMRYSSELVLSEGDIRADVEETLNEIFSLFLFDTLDFAGAGAMLLPTARMNVLSQTFRAVLEVFSPIGPLGDAMESKQQLAFVQMCLESTGVFVELFGCRGEGVSIRHIESCVSTLHAAVAAQLAQKVESKISSDAAGAEKILVRCQSMSSSDCGSIKTFPCLMGDSLLRATLRVTPEQVRRCVRVGHGGMLEHTRAHARVSDYPDAVELFSAIREAGGLRTSLQNRSG